MEIDLKKLSEPFPYEDIEWRISRSGLKENKPWGKVLAYVTARAIQERLDDVCGPENWQNQFTDGPQGGVLCGISIFYNDRWITKWNGSDNTNIEAVKGGLSGAEKRAGAEWGIGRYLYNLDEGWANFNNNGKHSAKIENKYYKWDAPELQSWSLPGGSGKPGIKPPNKTPPFDHAQAVISTNALLKKLKCDEKYIADIREQYSRAKSREDFTALQKTIKEECGG